MRSTSSSSLRMPPRALTLLELLVAMGVVIVIAAISVPAFIKAQRLSKRAASLNNMRNFVLADTLYFNDHRQFPPMVGIVPSSISRERLAVVAQYCGLSLPEGPVNRWPRRKKQPEWINCPIARTSGYAEGLTVGGGLYTGYIYVGGIEQSQMIRSGVATLANPEHNAPLRGNRRGVLWASVLGEFNSTEPRRFECFHYNTLGAYPDFCFHENEIEGIHRGWSDGSAEWLPASQMALHGASGSDLQIRHALGNYYY